MKTYRITDKSGKVTLVRSTSIADAIASIKRSGEKIVIGVKDGIEFSYKNGSFYADSQKIEDKFILNERN